MGSLRGGEEVGYGAGRRDEHDINFGFKNGVQRDEKPGKKGQNLPRL